jgi:hypothetical protein
MSDKLRAVTFVGNVEAETVKTFLNCFGLTVKRFTRTNRLGPLYQNYSVLT